MGWFDPSILIKLANLALPARLPSPLLWEDHKNPFYSDYSHTMLYIYINRNEEKD